MPFQAGGVQCYLCKRITFFLVIVLNHRLRAGPEGNYLLMGYVCCDLSPADVYLLYLLNLRSLRCRNLWYADRCFLYCNKYIYNVIVEYLIGTGTRKVKLKC